MVFLSAFLVRAISARILAFAIVARRFYQQGFLGGVLFGIPSRLLLHYAKRWIYIRQGKADNCSRNAI
jgi:hypothetical protein